MAAAVAGPAAPDVDVEGETLFARLEQRVEPAPETTGRCDEDDELVGV